MDEHNATIARLAAQVKHLFLEKKPFKIYHGTTNSTRKTLVDRSAIIDISTLHHILDVSRHSHTAVVEPNVSMESLVRATLPCGLLPAVVPEFPAITIGGAIAGTAGESSSFKYGFVNENVESMELILANGEITKASKDENEDLLRGVAGTFGSVAIATLMEIRLVEAKNHVRLTYHPVNSITELLWKMGKQTQNQSNDFVDGILYSRSRGVVISGTFAEDTRPNERIQSWSRARDEWYYLHVQDSLGDRHPHSTFTELVPTRDYLFRYDRGAFWAARHVFTYFAVPFTRFFRFLFDPFLHTKVLYHGLHENGMAKDNIIQDILLPADRAHEFLSWIDVVFGIYPLWLCPFRGGSAKKMGLRSAALEQASGNAALVSIGLWGPRLPDPRDFVSQNRKIEKKVSELGGVKWLYAQNHYSSDEFWTIYDRDSYDALRTKFCALHLPSVYDKTKYDWSAEERAIESSWLRRLFSFIWWIWPVPGIYGVIMVLMRSEYMLAASAVR